jgi:hypothetical protein
MVVVLVAASAGAAHIIAETASPKPATLILFIFVPNLAVLVGRSSSDMS